MYMSIMYLKISSFYMETIFTDLPAILFDPKDFGDALEFINRLKYVSGMPQVIDITIGWSLCKQYNTMKFSTVKRQKVLVWYYFFLMYPAIWTFFVMKDVKRFEENRKKYHIAEAQKKIKKIVDAKK